MTCAKLLFTNDRGEKFWFVAAGDPWPRDPEKLLVKRTATNEKYARCFDTAKDAADMLLLIGNGVGWSIVVQDPAADGK